MSVLSIRTIITECVILVNARRMHESYCNHPVCLSVTALVAPTYDVCATKLAYQCNLRCTQKVYIERFR